jgi:hypothetical protein
VAISFQPEPGTRAAAILHREALELLRRCMCQCPQV